MQAVALREVALSLQDGPFGSNLKSSHYVDHGVRVVRLQNIGPGYFDDRDRAFVTEEHFARLRKHECRPGDVLIATLGDPIVRACLQPPWLKTALHKADCLRLRCDPDRVAPEYIVQFLNSEALQSQAKALAHGQTRPRVNLTQLSTVRVPLPPLAEQRRVAAILGHADAVRSKRSQAIADIDSLADSVFSEVFGDPIRNAREWPVSTLRDEVASIQIGPFGSLMHHRDYVEGGTPVINPMHIVGGRIVPDPRHAVKEEKLKSLSRYLLHKDDVVIGRRGEMGRCAVVGSAEEGMVCGSGSAVIRPDSSKMTSVYICALLSDYRVRRQLEEMALGVTMLNLNSQIIGDLVLPVPPVCRQHEFQQILERVQAQKALAMASLSELDALRASLQYRAFRGEL